MNLSENYIKNIYQVTKKEEETAIKIFTERTGIEITKAYGNYHILIENVFTDQPTNKTALYFKYIGYGSLCFLGNINGKTKESLRYINSFIQKETENLILKLHYTNKDREEAIRQVYKEQGRPKTPIGIIRDKVLQA